MRKTTNEVKVGAFVIVGFICLTLILFFVSGVYLFRSGYGINVMYDYVSILDKGAPVRMAGVRVGEVSDVALVFDEGLQKTRVRVKLFIEKGVEIRENYLFKIQGTHILSEPHIEIAPIEGSAPIVKDSKTLEGVTPVAVEALIERANGIATNLDAIVASLRGAVQDEDTAKAMRNIVLNLSGLTKSLETVLTGSEGNLKGALENIDSTSSSLRVVLNRLEEGEGTVGKLFKDDELYQEMLEFVAEIKAHPWKLMKKD